MPKHACKYCAKRAHTAKRLCMNCKNKLDVVIRIKEMLDDAVESKLKRQKRKEETI